MWVPMHRQPSFALKKRRKIEEPKDPAFLDVPVLDRLHGYNTTLSKMEIGHSSIQGYRAYMEDEFIIDSLDIEDHVIVAIMDGHAGDYSAIFTKAHLKDLLMETSSWKKYKKLDEKSRIKQVNLIQEALVQAYVDLDNKLRQSEDEHNSGCTAVCSVITPSHVVCANVGDSRCVLGTKDSVVALTEDHKPENPEEAKRIEAAGGFVLFDRVNGELAMSRAIGDFQYKEDPAQTDREYKVICYPDVAIHVRSNKDQIMILACDGVWDVVTNEGAVSFITDEVLTSDDITTSEQAAEMLVDRAFNDGSTDNISVVIVQFNNSNNKLHSNGNGKAIKQSRE